MTPWMVLSLTKVGGHAPAEALHLRVPDLEGIVHHVFEVLPGSDLSARHCPTHGTERGQERRNERNEGRHRKKRKKHTCTEEIHSRAA